MSTEPVGLRINTDFERVPAALAVAARDIPVAVIGDVSQRLFSFPGGFHNYSRQALKFAGPAFTVKVRPGDNLFLHKALDVAQPGDIVICDAGGALQNAILGEMMGRYAASRGIAGIIIDGAIRDRAGLAKLPIPVYARGVTPNGPWKSGPGEIGHPIAAGGVSVAPGDLIVGDEDGVIVLPRAAAPDIIARAQAHAAVEAQWARQISEKNWPRGWVDDAIAQAG
ncbi:RraA family protein [Brenneria tiliae]|uniref:Putative 4-hydroxy-4-methyl-2-oxoglutarate aldolase n=1 Tax=Brenneria tiliae TaxID=2914984 RepID=A0ABT0MYA6_9GAMM|nr:RraA family protein [Brenneria tiliae]MCL2894747.1 RraA family protein [Brenneria tiliae]